MLRDPGHRDEDPVPGEQLHHQALDPRRPTVGAALQHDVAHLAHLVPGIVEDRQAADPRDEDRGRRCRHGVIISSDGILASMIEFKDLCLDVNDAGRGGGILGSGPRPAPRRRTIRTGWSTACPTAHVCGSTRCPNRVRSSSGCIWTCTWPRCPICSTWGPRCWTTPSAGRCWPTRRAASCAPSSGIRRSLPDYRLYELVVDSADPATIATWWAERFGVEVHHDHDQEFSWLEGPPGPPFGMVFSRVPEPKTVKNRLHWDVRGELDELLGRRRPAAPGPRRRHRLGRARRPGRQRVLPVRPDGD